MQMNTERDYDDLAQAGESLIVPEVNELRTKNITEINLPIKVSNVVPI